MSLETLILEQLQQNTHANRWIVAYSGGLDSTVLLHLVCQANRQLTLPKPVCAVHVNHQLSIHADQWEAHCQQQAASLGVVFESQKVDVATEGKGIEAAARQARYQVFDKYMDADDYLLMAHHSDDQAETFWLRLMRGAGVLGLSGMKAQRLMKNGFLLRPLLSVSRQVLEQYAQHHSLRWVEDESNTSLTFDRNFIRHQLLPLCEQRWPQVRKQLINTSSHLENTQQLLNDLANIDLQQLDQRKERYGLSIDWKVARLLSQQRLSNLLRFWCEQKQFALPNTQQLAQIHEQFFSRNAQLSSAVVQWGGCELRQFNSRLYLMREIPLFTPMGESLPWDITTPIQLSAAGQLVASVLNSTDRPHCFIAVSKIKHQTLTIRWRSGGKRCTPAGRARSQTIKKLLQEYQLDTWLRDRVPLIYSRDQLVAVGDLWVCDPFAAKIGEPALRLKWDL